MPLGPTPWLPTLPPGVPGATLAERRLTWSRGILADMTAHPDEIVRHAARLAVEVETDPERREAARKVMHLVGRKAA